MEKKKNLILNMLILVLAIALICVIVAFAKGGKKTKVTSESELRDKLKENITYEYVTKPQEEQNKMMEEEEKRLEQERQNEEAREQEEYLNEMMEDIEQGVKM